MLMSDIAQWSRRRRIVGLIACAVLLIGCLVLGPLTLLALWIDMQDGEVYFHQNVHGRIYHRWDTQPVAFVFTIGMWLTLALLFFSGIRPTIRQWKKIRSAGQPSPPSSDGPRAEAGRVAQA